MGKWSKGVVLAVAILGLRPELLPAAATTTTWPCASDGVYQGSSARVERHVVDGNAVNVVLPSRYHVDVAERYPVLFLLHGFAQDGDSWLALSDLIVLTADQPVIVVLPTTGLGSYLDWRDGSHQWETFTTTRLVPWVDASFRTLPDRGHRAVAGDSAGAWGAMAYAARHPDLFSVAASISGLPLDMTESPAVEGFMAEVEFVHALGCRASANVALVNEPFGAPVLDEVWMRNSNPLDLAGNLRDTTVYVGAGTGAPCRADDIVDPTAGYFGVEPYVAHQAARFHDELTRLSIAHVYDVLSCGTHDFPTWQQELHDFWPFLMGAFATPRTPPPSFSYRRVDPAFSVWGWTFTAEPTRAAEFLSIDDASRHSVTLEGSGRTRVVTPPWFVPGQVVATSDGNSVVADRSGRITLDVDLGAPHGAQQYTIAAEVAAIESPPYFTRHTVTFNAQYAS